MKTLHDLKCWKEPFNAIWLGDKTFEFRKDDREFREGDWVRIREWDEKLEQYTRRAIGADIGFILRAPGFGVPLGFCVFSLLEVTRL